MKCYIILLEEEIGTAVPAVDDYFTTITDARKEALEVFKQYLLEMYDLDEIKEDIKMAKQSLKKDNSAIYTGGHCNIRVSIHEMNMDGSMMFDPIHEPGPADFDDWAKSVIKKQNLPLKIDNIYPRRVIDGFLHDPETDNEGYFIGLMGAMGFAEEAMPVQIASYIQDGHTEWMDANGNMMRLAYQLDTDKRKVTCQATYLGKTGKDSYTETEEEWEEYGTPAERAKALSYDIGICSVNAACKVFPFEKYPVPWAD